MTDSSSPQPPLTYRDAGVDIDAGNALVERIKAVSKATFRSEVLTGLGGFGPCALSHWDIRNPCWYRGPMAWAPN